MGKTKNAPAPEQASAEAKAVAVVVNGETGISALTEQDIDSYLEAMGSKLLPVHKRQFVALCRAYGLNPFLKEIYGVPYTDRDTGDVTFSVIVGYEVYLKRAERSGLLKHWEVKISRDEPFGDDKRGELKAVISIERADRERPFVHEVYYNEYVQTKWDREKKAHVPTKFWATKPRTMLKKVAIAQGFRLAFPVECGGMPYTAEEAAYEVDYSDKGAGAPANSPFRTGGAAETGGNAAPRFEGEAEPANFDEKPPFDPDPPAHSSPAPETAGNGPKSPGTSDPAKTPPAAPAIAPAPSAEAGRANTKADDERPKPTKAPDPVPGQDSISGNGKVAAGRLEWVRSRYADRAGDFDRFLASKSWIKPGECLMDLTPGQIDRIYNNSETMDRAFEKFLAEAKK